MTEKAILGEAAVPIRATTDQLDKDLDAAKRKVESVGSKLANIGKGVVKAGLAAATAGVVGLGTALGVCASAAAEEEQGIARMGAAVRATGADWDEASAAIEDYLAAELRRTALDDGAGRDAITRLTTATGDYRKALELMPLVQDLARAKGIELAAAAEIVGKVSQGNTAILSRYGITLEKGASAQEALASMQARFGGQAEAYGNTSAGAMDKIKTAMGNLQETLGAALLPALATLGNLLSETLASPAVQEAIEGIASGIAEIGARVVEAIALIAQGNAQGGLSILFGPEVASFILGTLNALTSIGGWISSNWPALSAMLAAGLLTVVIPAFVSWATAAWAAATANIAAMAPVLAVIAAVMLVVGLLYLAWTNNWLGIQQIVEVVVGFVSDLISGALAAIQAWWAEHGENVMAIVNVLWSAVQAVVQTTVDNLTNAFNTAVAVWQWIWTNYGDTIMAYLRNLWAIISGIFRFAVDLISGIIDAFALLLQGRWEELGESLINTGKKLWADLEMIFNAALENIWLTLSTVLQLVQSGWHKAMRWIWDLTKEIWEGLTRWLGKTISGLWDNLFRRPLERLQKSWEGFWQGIRNFVSKILDGIHIKTPHIQVHWGDFPVLGRIPTGVSVAWYAMGGQFVARQPMLIGVGEAGPELVTIQRTDGRGWQPEGPRGGLSIGEFHAHYVEREDEMSVRHTLRALQMAGG